jgi:RHS repeat-associated protein
MSAFMTTTNRLNKQSVAMTPHPLKKILHRGIRLVAAIVTLSPVLALAQGTTPQTITGFNPTTPIAYANGATFNLTATGGGSASPVVFGSNSTSICTVSGSTVSVLSVGSCLLTANQAGDATYAAAPEVQRTVVINKGNQTITFGTLASRTMVPATFDLTATASSGLTVSYASTTQTRCTVSGATVTLVSAGTCTITASQAGNGNFNAANNVSQSFSISLATQTISFPTIGTKFILDSPLTLNATASSGLPVVFSTNTPSICTVSGNIATLVAQGSCQIIVNQPGNGSYQATSASQWFTVSRTNQTVTFPAIGSKFILDSPLTLSATSSVGLPITFSTNTPSVCSVSGTTATLIAPGSCQLFATQPGTVAYNSAQVSQWVTVSKTNQTVTFPTIGPKFILDSPLALTATSSSGLPVTFSTNTPSVCTVSGSSATLIAPGSCQLFANQAGNAAYNVGQASQWVTVSKTNQTIAFAAIATQSMLPGTLALTATSSSGLTVSFTSSTPSVCTVSGTTATFVAAGTCTINAVQAGNTAYNSASLARSFTVARANQTITFGAIASQPFGTPITLSATSSSGLTVTFTSVTTGFCTVSGTTVTPVAVGTCTINANQSGNVTYNPATQVQQSFSIVKGNQTVSFGSMSAQPLGTSTAISATSTSGLAVSLTSATPSICTISGNNATLLALGTCTINGNQAGSVNWNAAPQASLSFTVVQGNQAITNFAPTTPIGYRLNGTFPLTATGGASGNPVVFASTSPSICTVSGSTATIVTVGTCTLAANQAGNANYNAAPEVTATVNITQGTQTISVFYPNSSLVAGATVQLTATGGSSPNLVSFTSGSTSICTVGASSAGANGTSVASLNVLAAGECLLTANQAGDALYLPAAPVSLTLTIGAGSQIFYIHTDHLGTPRAITQASGNGKVWEWKNDDPFGANMPDENPSGIAGTFKYNLRFPGQYYDQETGTYYNYFRDYDPSVGRYVQSDPIGLEGGVNTYAYVEGNPLSLIDPFGLWAWGDPIDQDWVNGIAGFGDGVFKAVTFGIGDLNQLRTIAGISGGVETSCAAYTWSTKAGIGVGIVALGGAFFASWQKGAEISFGKNFRIAPWGNRTGHPYGRWPHYHRRGTESGQGIGRHRPWETKSTDKSWRDRF